MKHTHDRERNDGTIAFARSRARLWGTLLFMVLSVSSEAASPPGQGAGDDAGAASPASAVPVPPVSDFKELQPDSVPAASKSLHCSLDAIDEHAAPLAIVLDGRAPVTFVGWIADDENGVPQNMAVLLIGEKTSYEVVGSAGLPRTDVAAAKHNPAFASSGYSVTGNPAAVPQGEYRVALIGQFGSVRLLCPLGRTVALK